jgi:hypothetical protein
MQEVSQEWLDIQKEQLVNEGYVDISLNIGDTTATVNSTAKASYIVNDENKAEEYEVSSANQIVSNTNVNCDVPLYALLEQNLILLDGSFTTVPDSKDDYGFVGYASNELSGTDMQLQQRVYITPQTTVTPQIPYITIVWGEQVGDYPKKFNVTFWKNNIQVGNVEFDKNVKDTTNFVKIPDEAIAGGYDSFNINIIEWCLPYRRARISDVYLGLKKVFTKSELTAFAEEQTVEPIGSELPTGQITFSIDNTDLQFDPNNPDGLYDYLSLYQEIYLRYGFKIDDCTKEYIKGGTYYLTEWEIPQNGVEANFTARDVFAKLSGPFAENEYKKWSLYDLASAIFTTSAGISNKLLEIDTSLKDVTTQAIFSQTATNAECLQYIAQAAQCIMYADRNGVLQIKPIGEVPSDDEIDYSITGNNSFEYPEISTVQSTLGTVTTKVYDYYQAYDESTIYKSNIEAKENEILTFVLKTPAVVTSIKISKGSTTFMPDDDYDIQSKNANKIIIEFHTKIDSGTITIKGKEITSLVEDYNYTFDENGTEALTIDNPLITSEEMAASVSKWAAAWYGTRKEITLGSWRADPRLDPCDVVLLENKFTTEKMRVTSIDLTFTGAFKASGEGRIVE